MEATTQAYWEDWDHLVGPRPTYAPDPAAFRRLYHSVFEAAVAERAAATRFKLLGDARLAAAHGGAAAAIEQIGKMFEPLLS